MAFPPRRPHLYGELRVLAQPQNSIRAGHDGCPTMNTRCRYLKVLGLGQTADELNRGQMYYGGLSITELTCEPRLSYHHPARHPGSLFGVGCRSSRRLTAWRVPATATGQRRKLSSWMVCSVLSVHGRRDKRQFDAVSRPFSPPAGHGMAFPDGKELGRGFGWKLMHRIFASGWTRLGGLSSLYRHFLLFGTLTSVPLWGRDWRGAAALVGVGDGWMCRAGRMGSYADGFGLFPPLGGWIRRVCVNVYDV